MSQQRISTPQSLKTALVLDPISNFLNCILPPANLSDWKSSYPPFSPNNCRLSFNLNVDVLSHYALFLTTKLQLCSKFSSHHIICQSFTTSCSFQTAGKTQQIELHLLFREGEWGVGGIVNIVNVSCIRAESDLYSSCQKYWHSANLPCIYIIRARYACLKILTHNIANI